MRLLFLIPVLVYSCTHAGVLSEDSLPKKKPALNYVYTTEDPFCNKLCRDVVGLKNPRTNLNENYILDRSLYFYKVDTLAQVRFWRSIMNLQQDSALISVAETRDIIARMSLRDWNSRSEDQKSAYRDSVRAARGLDSTYRIYITTGKKFFYDFDNTSQNFNKGIKCFMENGVDPWFAQAILLIESPNKLQKSNAGAYGPFQLMKDVARMYGLKVNREVDERADFERSAYAASCLIKNICVPYTRRMLDSLKITNYQEQELWFKLLVMHVYHAGAGNVQKALYSISPTQGNMDLVYRLWNTTTARFKSASQNYSQLVLAAMLEMNDRNRLLISENSIADN